MSTTNPWVLTFHNANREILRITPEGRLEKGEGISDDEMSQHFFNIIQSHFHSSVSQMREELETEKKKTNHAELALASYKKLLEDSEKTAEENINTLKSEIAKLREELALQKVQNNHNWMFQEISEEALKRAESAETEVKRLLEVVALKQQTVDHLLDNSDFLIGYELAKERVRAETAEAEVRRLTAFCKEFAWGEDDSAGYRTLQACVQRAEAELAIMSARFDWLLETAIDHTSYDSESPAYLSVRRGLKRNEIYAAIDAAIASCATKGENK